MDQVASLISKGHAQLLEARGHALLEQRLPGISGSETADSQGRRYLDAIGSAGTFNLGRHQSELKDELRKALRETDQGNFPMISVEKARLAEALSSFVGRGLECALFGVTRGETLDAACKVARGATGREGLVSLQGAWHGETGFAMSLSTRQDHLLFGPMIPRVTQIPPEDLAAARAAIGPQTAAVVIEPVQAENGCLVLSPDYLMALERLCRQQGALLVVDESQTGFGRTGSCFAFARAGIQPDMLLVGEALGGGLFPIAATLMTQAVNEYLNRHPMIHLSTFGGSDLGCRVALKALELYGRLRPWDNAWKVGGWLRGELHGLQRAHDPLRGVSGEGMLLAVHFGTEADATAFCRGLAANGVLALPGRVNGSSVILRPSLLLTLEEAAVLLEAVAKALAGMTHDWPAVVRGDK